jgi:hypothetical protein
MNEVLNVVVFTCEGREQLLRQTWKSFAPALEKLTHRRILAVDGQVSPDAVACVKPDVLVQNYRRRGYVQSMLNAIPIVNSEFFFWLEDDWQITGEFDLPRAVAALKENPRWMQVRWSKKPTLEKDDHPLIPGIHVSSVGFSGNPCLCRTELIRQGLQHLVDGPRGNDLAIDFFENILIKWARDQNLVCTVFDPRGTIAVTHLGFLESSGREWLMSASLEREPAEHFFGMGDTSPELWRRLWMACKLSRSMLGVLLRIPTRDVAYELAYRIITTTKITLTPTKYTGVRP